MGGKYLFVTAVVLSLLAPTASVQTAHKCGTFITADERCDKDVVLGDTFQLDCTDTINTLIPAALLTNTDNAMEVCYGTALRTDMTTDCPVEKRLIKYYANKGIEITAAIATGWTIKNNGFTGTEDVIFNGSCEATGGGTPGGFFNAVIKGTTTTTSSTSSPSGGRGTTIGLATAASVALLGLVAF